MKVPAMKIYMSSARAMSECVDGDDRAPCSEDCPLSRGSIRSPDGIAEITYMVLKKYHHSIIVVLSKSFTR